MPSPASDLIAFDVGGANIKAADGFGWAATAPFAMWREWRRLPETLGRFLASRPERVVATMTGELADCFPSRRAGVEHIVAALVSAAGAAEVGIYTTDGRLLAPSEAIAAAAAVAASNWHALARLAASMAPADRTFLLDIGSTTVDIIPIQGGRPTPLARDDAGRMASGELVYTGVERTPVAAVVRWLPHRGARRPVAAERFAQSQDAWLLLDALPEEPSTTDTADGGPATRDAARVRLARTMLLDPECFTPEDAHRAATWIAAVQARQVARSLARVVRATGWPPDAIVLSGHGDALASLALTQFKWCPRMLSLRHHLSEQVSRAAPAHAVALIARGSIP
jgi:probable H4MPT-linked C1 transfer pathway protein